MTEGIVVNLDADNVLLPVRTGPGTFVFTSGGAVLGGDDAVVDSCSKDEIADVNPDLQDMLEISRKLGLAGPGGFTFSTSHPGNSFEMQIQV